MTARRFLGAVTVGALLGLGAGYFLGGNKIKVPETRKVEYVVTDSIKCERDSETLPDLKVRFEAWKSCDSKTLWGEVVDAYGMHRASDKDISAKVREVANANDLTEKNDIIKMRPGAKGCKDTKLGKDTLPEVPAGKEIMFPGSGKKADKGCRPTYRTEEVDVPTGDFRTESGGFPWWYPLLGTVAGGIGYLFGRGRRDGAPEPPRGDGPRPDEEAPGRRLVPEEPAAQAEAAPVGGEPIVTRDTTAGGEERVPAAEAQAAVDAALAATTVVQPPVQPEPVAPVEPAAPAEVARPEGERGPEGPQPPTGGGGRRSRPGRRGGANARGTETPAGGGPEGPQSYFSEAVEALIKGYKSYRVDRRVKADTDNKAGAYRAFKDRGETRKAGGKSVFDRDVAEYLSLDAEMVNAYKAKSAEQVAAEYRAQGVDISASTIRRLAKEKLGEVGYRALMAEKKERRKLAYRGDAAVNDNKAKVLPYITAA